MSLSLEDVLLVGLTFSTKFGQLVLRKISKIVATRCLDFQLKMCLAAGLRWGSLSAPPDSLAAKRGPTSKGKGWEGSGRGGDGRGMEGEGKGKGREGDLLQGVRGDRRPWSQGLHQNRFPTKQSMHCPQHLLRDPTLPCKDNIVHIMCCLKIKFANELLVCWQTTKQCQSHKIVLILLYYQTKTTNTTVYQVFRPAKRCTVCKRDWARFCPGSVVTRSQQVPWTVHALFN